MQHSTVPEKPPKFGKVFLGDNSVYKCVTKESGIGQHYVSEIAVDCIGQFVLIIGLNDLYCLTQEIAQEMGRSWSGNRIWFIFTSYTVECRVRSNVLGAHILVQELALTSWSKSIFSMERLPGIILGPWYHLLQGGLPGLWALGVQRGGSPWSMGLQVTQYLLWKEWSCQLGQSFCYYVMPLKGEA